MVGGQTVDDGSLLIGMDPKPENSYGSVTTNEPAQPLDRNVFSDGTTRIDFVLAWEEPRNSPKEGAGVNPAHQKWREEFLRRLRRSGLLQEQKKVAHAKKDICFVLLSAPWNVLCYYAEDISLRVPLQVVNSPNITGSEQLLMKLSLPNPMAQEVPNPPVCYYTCQFRNNKLERFLGSNDRETFFKTTQRHQVLYEILARTPYGSVKRGQVGIDRMLNEQVFTAAYPLHEGEYKQPKQPAVSPQSLSIRQILYTYWAKWARWKNYQPLDHIREYFGEKIALYFAWLGFYTAWLLPASFIGTVIFLNGLWIMVTDVPVKEVCDTRNNFLMCPACNICSYWNYSSICVTYKMGILFDNGGTVFFSVFMSLWAVTFLEYWKRTCSTLSHRWNCSDFEEIEERPRPEFTAMAPMTMRNPVTGAEEPYFPENKRFKRILSGCIVIIVLIFLVLMCLIAIILYRTIVSIVIQKSHLGFISSSAKRIASITGSVLNLLVILMLSRLYTSLAQILTRWEMHRTQNKYEDMFILKVFVFQFVNFYSSPIYIAFFKGRFVGFPGHYNTLFGIRNEDCGAGGCLIELAQELLVIMVGKQLINNIQEFLVPKFKSWMQKRAMNPQQQKEKNKEEGNDGDQQKENISPWEADYQLLTCEGLLSEYLEMVIQFGFITIFVAACPLAPLFSLINNWIEIRLDAQKFVTEYRRPVVERSQDIGIWLLILQFITQVAVLINAFLIAFTSSFLPRLYYRYTRDITLKGYINFTLATSPQNFTHHDDKTPCRYVGLRDDNGEHIQEFYHLLAIRLCFVIIFEHVVFLIGRLIDMMVPDIPEEVELRIKREHYMAKAALAENRSMGKNLIPEQDDLTTSLRSRGAKPSVRLRSKSPPPKLNRNPKGN